MYKKSADLENFLKIRLFYTLVPQGKIKKKLRIAAPPIFNMGKTMMMFKNAGNVVYNRASNSFEAHVRGSAPFMEN